MKIAILGAGMVANFIRSKLVQAGNHATLGRVASNSAGPERLHPIAGKAARILSVVAVCILQVAVYTRGPQMMNERSYETGVQSKAQDQGVLVLYGDSFVAPRWGEMTNAAFRYRLTIGEVQNDRHVVRLYLTPQSGESAKEFLAFEYIYTRRR
jgi:hypothetical protein